MIQRLTVCLLLILALLVLLSVSGCDSLPPRLAADLSSGARYVRDGQKEPALQALGYKGWFAESIPYLHKAIELTPSDPAGRVRRYELYVVLGNAYTSIKDYDKAESAFRTATGLCRLNAAAYNGWGYMYADANTKLNDALRLTKHAVELAPNDGSIVDSLGWAYFRLGRYEEAERHLRRAVELMPDSAEIRYHLGMAHEKTGDLAGAWVEYHKALILKREYPEVEERLRMLGRGNEPALQQPRHDASVAEPFGIFRLQV